MAKPVNDFSATMLTSTNRLHAEILHTVHTAAPGDRLAAPSPLRSCYATDFFFFSFSRSKLFITVQRSVRLSDGVEICPELQGALNLPDGGTAAQQAAFHSPAAHKRGSPSAEYWRRRLTAASCSCGARTPPAPPARGRGCRRWPAAGGCSACGGGLHPWSRGPGTDPRTTRETPRSPAASLGKKRKEKGETP